MVFLLTLMMMMMNCYCGIVDWLKTPFHPEPLPDFLTNGNLRHAASRIWRCAEPDFWHWWMKLYGTDNHYTKVPLALTYFESNCYCFFLISWYCLPLACIFIRFFYGWWIKTYLVFSANAFTPFEKTSEERGENKI